jgi:hypothetical protein
MGNIEQNKEIIDNLRNPMTLSILSVLTNVDIDYTFESLMKCEEAINNLYPEGHKPLPTTLIPFGFLLGETIVRKLGGEWDYDADSIWNVKVKVINKSDGEMVLKPFLRIEKFWKDRSDAMSAMYRMVEYSSGADLSPENIGRFEDDDGWVHFPDGFKFRLRRSDEFNNEK